MDWMQSLDVRVFRFINHSLSNPLFDQALPFFSWNPLFVPSLAVLTIGLLWKGGARGRLFLFFLALAILVGDGVIIGSLKRAIGRPRPFLSLADANVLIGRGASGSMPSGHAANWFAATMIAFVYYRRSLWLMLPLALTIALARVYLGVHYPSDVLVGACLGAGYALGFVCSLNGAWQIVGRRWFPLWWSRLPSLYGPAVDSKSPADSRDVTSSRPLVKATLDQHWLRLGYLVIAALLLVRLAYLAGGVIELSEDEAYQWLWSKHLALSYYSKPPLIAYTQWAGTALWGDTAFGVRFFSPVISAILGCVLLRFLAEELNPRAGFWLVILVSTTPLLAVGTVLMTIDPLSVLFWTAAMISGWRAVKSDSTIPWLWTGLWMGWGFLSKYVALFQLLCWLVFFILCRPARRHLRRAGPYWALVLAAAWTWPVLIWNHQNGWITVSHLAERGGLSEAWQPTLRFFWDFLIAESLLLNPWYVVAVGWAAWAFWRRRDRSDLMVYLFSMGAPLFLFYLFYTFRARVQPNWIAPSVLPLFCLSILYWEGRWREAGALMRHWLGWGVSLGAMAVVFLHNTDLLQKATGTPMSAKLDPLTRVRSWKDVAREVSMARSQFLREGKPVFIIGDHYGITGLLSFYMPEAKSGVPHTPLVYYPTSARPENQFYFWPGYQQRKGQNAIYVVLSDTPQPPPERIKREFATVTDLGIREILYRGRVFHRVQLFACRDLQ